MGERVPLIKKEAAEKKVETEMPSFLVCECEGSDFKIGTFNNRTFFICAKCDLNYVYDISFRTQTLKVGKPENDKS